MSMECVVQLGRDGAGRVDELRLEARRAMPAEFRFVGVGKAIVSCLTIAATLAERFAATIAMRN